MPRKRIGSVNIRGRTIKTYLEFRQQGWDYIINPDTGELHDLRVGNFLGSHNLINASFERFYPVIDVGNMPITEVMDGEEIDVFDINTGQVIGTYILNKCGHCF